MEKVLKLSEILSEIFTLFFTSKVYVALSVRQDNKYQEPPGHTGTKLPAQSSTDFS